HLLRKRQAAQTHSKGVEGGEGRQQPARLPIGTRQPEKRSASHGLLPDAKETVEERRRRCSRRLQSQSSHDRHHEGTLVNLSHAGGKSGACVPARRGQARFVRGNAVGRTSGQLTILTILSSLVPLHWFFAGRERKVTAPKNLHSRPARLVHVP